MSSGLNTLLTQAEGRGDETIHMRRLYVNRTVLVMFLTGIPLGLLNWFSGSILSLAGQPVRTCVHSCVNACVRTPRRHAFFSAQQQCRLLAPPKLTPVCAPPVPPLSPGPIPRGNVRACMQGDVVAYATNFAHLLFAGTLVPSMAFYLQQQVLNTRRQALVPLVSTIVGTAVNVVLSLFFLRGFSPEPLNATELPLGNQSSYLGAAVARGAGGVVMVIITGAYMILSRDQICPFGCLCCSPRARRRRRRKNHHMHQHHDCHGSDGGSNGEPDHLPETELNFWAWKGGFQLLLALCGPSMLLMISEWWGFEALAIMAGNLPDGAACLDANGVLYNINLVMYVGCFLSTEPR